MPEELADRKEAASTVGNATGTNLEGVIDRRVNETRQHEYWRPSANIEAHIRILEGIERS
jgi:hypothetical protein